MKYLIILTLLSFNVFTNDQPSHVFFMRHFGQGKIGQQSQIYIDGSAICALDNHSYFSRDIAPGTRSFKIQAGKNASKGDELTVDIEAGKDYFFYVTADVSPGKSNLILLQITEVSAKKLMSEFEKGECK